MVCTVLVLTLPLLSFIFSFLTSERYSWLVGMNAPIILLISTICAVILLVSGWNKDTALIKVDWFDIGQYSLSANLAISNTTLLMLTVVSAVSFLVHVYSIGYMADDAGAKKY